MTTVLGSSAGKGCGACGIFYSTYVPVDDILNILARRTSTEFLLPIRILAKTEAMPEPLGAALCVSRAAGGYRDATLTLRSNTDSLSFASTNGYCSTRVRMEYHHRSGSSPKGATVLVLQVVLCNTYRDFPGVVF